MGTISFLEAFESVCQIWNAERQCQIFNLKLLAALYNAAESSHLDELLSCKICND
jgi:hypothetical protein